MTQAIVCPDPADGWAFSHNEGGKRNKKRIQRLIGFLVVAIVCSGIVERAAAESKMYWTDSDTGKILPW